MKVLLVNTHSRGGAAKACIRLHEGLLNNGVDSTILFLRNKEKIKNSKNYFDELPQSKGFRVFLSKVVNKLKSSGNKRTNKVEFIRKRSNALDKYSYPISSYDITNLEVYKEADVINLHWVSGFLDYESFFKKNKKPVVWTLHDMNPFTGGEHYTESFLGMDDTGFPIKRIITEWERKEFNKVLDFKRGIFKNKSNITIVTLCNWMNNVVNKSNVFNHFTSHIIPNGIDTTMFKPFNKSAVREKLEFPKNKLVLLFVADYINNNRKGFQYLLKALSLIDSKDVSLCVVGNLKEQIDTNFELHIMGHIKDEHELAKIYSAADAFIIPSLMDNLPNTAIESLCCGTPVIGFPVGGLLDIIQHNENGILSNNISAISLAESINWFLENTHNFNSEIIRESAVAKYADLIQSKKYTQLFENIIVKK